MLKFSMPTSLDRLAFLGARTVRGVEGSEGGPLDG